MFCRLVILCSLNCVTETMNVMEGHILASPALKYNRDLHTPLLAEIFDVACRNCLSIKKKILSCSNGDFQEQRKSWSLP